jgi:hypothetical protein
LIVGKTNIPLASRRGVDRTSDFTTRIGKDAIKRLRGYLKSTESYFAALLTRP